MAQAAEVVEREVPTTGQNTVTFIAGNGANYGGGGGGDGSLRSGTPTHNLSTGGDGLIVITYTPVVSSTVPAPHAPV
jgi:hypothetical protein